LRSLTASKRSRGSQACVKRLRFARRAWPARDPVDRDGVLDLRHARQASPIPSTSRASARSSAPDAS
jgi:hypothetical protein